MVNISSASSYDEFLETENRLTYRPLAGYRRTLTEFVPQTKCLNTGKNPIDRLLPAFSTCSFELTPKDYRLSDFEPIVLYVDTPLDVFSFIETCKTTGQQQCDTQEFQVGTDYSFKWAPDWAVRIIFENDGSTDNIFQIEYSTQAGSLLES